MNLAKTIITLLLCCCITTSAQTADYSSWQARLNDDTPIAALSLPGAHDAATGEGLHCIAGFGKTQELTLAEQWECGVRAFDLRPAVNDEDLHIYHGIIKTGISFSNALEIICKKLEANPTEFAIVLLREESDSETDKERTLWPQAVGNTIAGIGERAAVFAPGMTVGQMRGKILFLSRNEYIGCNKGAAVIGWSHSTTGTTDAEIISYDNGDKARLQVQDLFKTTDNELQKAKETAVMEYLSLAGNASNGVWTVNFLSAYSTTFLGITPLPTSAGYKRNAVNINRFAADILEARTTATNSPTGILFMDYAGTDKAGGGIWHPAHFCTSGKRLVELIIEQNF